LSFYRLILYVDKLEPDDIGIMAPALVESQPKDSCIATEENATIVAVAMIMKSLVLGFLIARLENMIPS
jgi:hypothetical protein